MINYLESLSPAKLGIFLSIFAGAGATALGALPLLFIRKKITQKIIDFSLGFSAGVMLAASIFSLIVPSIELGGLKVFVIGTLAGVVFVDFMDERLPHEHFVQGKEGPKAERVKNILLFVFAIIIHNFPEGLAVGVGGFSDNALSLATAIGIQNMLEGLAVTAALIAAEYSVEKSVFIGVLSGIVEPIGGLIGVALVSFSTAILPFSLAFAGGAMIYVVSDEVIPETHSGNNEKLATYALIIGFIAMTVMDNLI